MKNIQVVIIIMIQYFQTGTSIDLYYPYYSTIYREPTPVHMSNVQCLGNESRLTDCPHNSGGNGPGATLECYPYSSGACLYLLPVARWLLCLL